MPPPRTRRHRDPSTPAQTRTEPLRGGTSASPDPPDDEPRTGWVPDGADAPPGAAARPRWAATLLRSGPWGTLAERWVPEPLRGARISPKRRGAALLAVIAALAAVVTVVGIWWTKPEPSPITPAAHDIAAPPADDGVHGSDPDPHAPALHAPGRDGAPAGGAAGAAPEPVGPEGPGATAPAGDDAGSTAPTPTGPILVSVTGAVRHPGLVTVPADARVADAIAAAGGAVNIDDLTGLNLAAHLSDGDSVVVAPNAGSRLQREPPRADGAAGAAATSPAGQDGPVNINTADQAGLERLPGVGPATAAKIIAYRAEHGPFTSVDQLQAVPGIGPATVARLAPHVTT